MHKECTHSSNQKKLAVERSEFPLQSAFLLRPEENSKRKNVKSAIAAKHAASNSQARPTRRTSAKSAVNVPIACSWRSDLIKPNRLVSGRNFFFKESTRQIKLVYGLGFSEFRRGSKMLLFIEMFEVSALLLANKKARRTKSTKP